MTDRKQQRKEFRRDINRSPRQGDNVQGSGCLMLMFPAVLGFLLTYGLGLVGLTWLLP